VNEVSVYFFTQRKEELMFNPYDVTDIKNKLECFLLKPKKYLLTTVHTDKQSILLKEIRLLASKVMIANGG
jgi:hypothetical protein